MSGYGCERYHYSIIMRYNGNGEKESMHADRYPGDPLTAIEQYNHKYMFISRGNHSVIVQSIILT